MTKPVRCFSANSAVALMVLIAPTPASAQSVTSVGEARIVTAENASTEHELFLANIRVAIQQYKPEIRHLFESANISFGAYLQAECHALIPEWYKGGSARVTNAQRCVKEAYLNRMRILCPTYNPFLAREQRCLVADPATDPRASQERAGVVDPPN